MRAIKLASTLAILLMPSVATAQSEGAEANKQKAWLVANFASGLTECAVVRGGDGFSVTGAAQVTLGDSRSGTDGFNVSVVDSGPAPVVRARSINTKATRGKKGRSPSQSCGLMPPRRDTVPAARKGQGGRINESTVGGITGSVIAGSAVAGITAGVAAGRIGATCSVSGAPDTPTVRFTLPLAVFNIGSAKSYVGHVTLIKTEAGSPPVSKFLSRKGYDYYKAKSDTASARAPSEPDPIEMTVIATCDASGLSTSSAPLGASWMMAAGSHTNPYFVSNELAGEME